MKRLLPSLRAKKRYLAFELISEVPVSRSDLVKEVMSSASSLLGDVTASECDIKVLGFEESKGIIQKQEHPWQLSHGSMEKGQLCIYLELQARLKGQPRNFFRIRPLIQKSGKSKTSEE